MLQQKIGYRKRKPTLAPAGTNIHIKLKQLIYVWLGCAGPLKGVLLAGYDMMIEGGTSEGGDVQAKDMRTEINGGQDGNIEVSSLTSAKMRS